MQYRYLQVNGIPSRIIEAGSPDAPAVLLIHGLALGAEVWEKNIEALSAQHHVIAVDLLGHGFTASMTPLDGVNEKVTHLLALADALDLRSFALSGSSYGGLVAAHAYLRAPERVSHLVLSCTGLVFKSYAELAPQYADPRSIYQADVTSFANASWWDARLRGSLVHPEMLPGSLPATVAHSFAMPWGINAWQRTIFELANKEAYRTLDLSSRLHAIKVPTLVIWGRQDHSCAVDVVSKAMGDMIHATLTIFDACGHYPMLEHADAWNTQVLQFLRK